MPGLRRARRPRSAHRVAGRLAARRDAGPRGVPRPVDRSGRIQLLARVNELGEEGFERLVSLDLGDLIGVDGAAIRTRSGELSLRVDGVHAARQVAAPAARQAPRPDRRRDPLSPPRARPDRQRGGARAVRRRARGSSARCAAHSTTTASSRSRRRSCSRSTAAPRRARSRPTTTPSTASSTCGSRPSSTSSARSSAASSASTSSARTSATRASRPSTTPSSRWSSGTRPTPTTRTRRARLEAVVARRGGDRRARRRSTSAAPWRRITLRDGDRSSGPAIDMLELREPRDSSPRRSRSAGLAPRDRRAHLGRAGRRPAVEVRRADAAGADASSSTTRSSCRRSPRRHRTEPGLVERWEAYAGGIEIANAFSELNDPDEQRARFVAAARGGGGGRRGGAAVRRGVPGRARAGDAADRRRRARDRPPRDAAAAARARSARSCCSRRCAIRELRDARIVRRGCAIGGATGRGARGDW